MRTRRSKILEVLAVTGAGFALITNVLALSIDSTDKFSWGENIGWMNWGTPEGDVDVPSGDGELTGYVWGENVGWISLNCSNTSSCGTVDYQATKTGSDIAGYAWGENVGWISFNCTNTSSCGTVSYAASYSSVTLEFSGYAWGENVGWVVMNCDTTSTCGTVDYKVKTTPTPGGGGGGGGYIPSPPPVTPPASPPPATPTPSPVLTPFVSPPSSPPPSVQPSALPSAGPTPEPGPIETIGDVLDKGGEILGDAIDRVLGNSVDSGAIALAGIALVPLLIALVQATQAQALGSMAFSFFQIIGLKKKARVWGTVYDTRTKHPLPFVRVQILDEASRVLETRFADRDGRYGFLLGGTSVQGVVRRVRIVAAKNGYAFPSKNVAPGSTDFVVYERPYFGEVVEVATDIALNYDIPMDPLSAVGVISRPPFAAFISKGFEHALNAAFYLGLILVPWNLIRHPNTLTITVAVVFFGANALRIIAIFRPYGRIRDLTGTAPMAYALVTLHDETGTRKAFAVSDEQGRYFLSAERGRHYTMRIRTPANVEPPRTTAEEITSDSRSLKQGWVTLDTKV